MGFEFHFRMFNIIEMIFEGLMGSNEISHYIVLHTKTLTGLICENTTDLSRTIAQPRFTDNLLF